MSGLKRRRKDYVQNPQKFFANFISGAGVTACCVSHENSMPIFTASYGDWTDDMAVKVGSEVLRVCTGYPTERVRRCLYKKWLSVFAAQEWPETFDHVLLECVVVTPSPSDPSKPLFGDLFRLAAASSRREGTYLETRSFRRLFRNVEQREGDFKSASGLVGHLGTLLSVYDDRKALYEAGLIIGFLSLLLSSLSAINVNRFIALFRELETSGLAGVLPTSFAGGLPCPAVANLEKLRTRQATRQGVLRPWVSGLAVAQYTLYLRAGDDAPRKDVFFLEQAFMLRTKYRGLDNVALLEMFAKETRLPMDYLNRMMDGKDKSTWARKLMDFYLTNVAAPERVQQSAPWCRVVDPAFFRGLEITDGRCYALKIMCFLGRHWRGVQYKKWSNLVYETVSVRDVNNACAWADHFRELLDKGMLRPAEVDVASSANSEDLVALGELPSGMSMP